MSHQTRSEDYGAYEMLFDIENEEKIEVPKGRYHVKQCLFRVKIFY